MDSAEKASQQAQAALNKRLQTIYSEALDKALENQNVFLEKLAKLDELEKTLPESWTAEKIQEWKDGYQTEYLRRDNVIQQLANDLAAVGGTASEEIQLMLNDVYGINNKYITDMVENTVGISIQPYTSNQINVILQETETPFTKIAYNNLGSNKQIVARLGNEMAQATLNGETQKKIIARIRKVTGQSEYQAKRVAQTERVRIQSQARLDTTKLAEEKGVEIQNEWRAKMHNTRDTHKQANGERRKPGEKFSNGLEYPGDPSGGAKEVINCHCVLIPRVSAKG